MQIDPEVERRIRDEVDRFAEMLDKDTPPIAFEDVTVLGYPAHSSFRDDTLLINTQSVHELSFDQIRTSIAYTLAVLVQIKSMYRRTVLGWITAVIGSISVVVAGAYIYQIDLFPLTVCIGGLLFIRSMRSRSWRRISSTDKLVYRLVGDLDLVIEFIRTIGFRGHGDEVKGNAEMMERRIAVLRSL